VIRINITSVLVDDQVKALAFYTEKLGFIKKTDEPAGEARWLTVVFKKALVTDGIPFTQFAVDDVYAEVERLKGLGVEFTQDATDMGPVVTAVFDDTCGNLIQIAAMK
jgi:catechol 2,3-dioxygenase-like lactoylglutathione lyase family enzyme